MFVIKQQRSVKWLVLTPLLVTLACSEKPAAVSFAAFTDCQFADLPDMGTRHYRASRDKLRDFVAAAGGEKIDFAIQLGDLIEEDFGNFDVLLPLLGELPVKMHHVLGNHDFSVADARKAEVPSKLGLAERYYAFGKSGWRFVVLDGNDISFHAQAAGSAGHKAAERYHAQKAEDSPLWNGAVGAQQLSWLRGELSEACAKGEQVIVFNHFPLLPEAPHVLWNAQELLDSLESKACVRAYISGHGHTGDYVRSKGIHHLTLRGMVETDENAFAFLRLREDEIEVEGHGREPDRSLKIP